MSSRTCHCGCDSFRFKFNEDGEALKQSITGTMCRNCGHILADHLPLTRSAQAN